MFGYVIANPISLSPMQKNIYRGYYCGLCRHIGENFGGVKRLVLTYDMAFLTLLLSSLYELPEKIENQRCIIHPTKKHQEITTAATSYTAAMNIALAYYNFLDNWHDDKSPLALLQSKLLKNCLPPIREDYCSKIDMIMNALQTLADMEKERLQDPDAVANVFGALLGEIFVWRQDHWSDLLRQMGAALGRAIYLMDAVLDLPADHKKNRYNPLLSRWVPDWSHEQFTPILKIMLGECTDAFERLPIVKNADLLRNILYEGIWTRFYQRHSGILKEEKHV